MKDVSVPWPAGIRKTKQRACVLSVLEHADSPMSAMEICEQTKQEDCPVWLSSVYRILDLFEKENVVLKTTRTDGDKALYELSSNKHRHYAVCLGCHKIVELDNCPLENFVPQLADSGFQVLGHKLELYGYCRDCSSKK